ncbi:uncharacterized protein K452DRAFT_287594 [Aplosporella prunicola CBS 121167]|uniref:Uncharacterized protein n=1 Tax=Aplosporella prunicola CBS 121167 TaxID=1176127 RepID=A0A6A6BE40_9PEZI|nr:uncharacterized protein K452DRAFT_287594 [Aplosporella prunicola CBS 121167]KAF2141643.1 hypothetical protein K452DRAFT_287594 [Aplosporella prunicola CBS 121167]
MSKLFTSLQLTPENFLRLQAAAKQYMLDEAHAERQSCVGSRGKGDTDMVKLRLFNCVRDFLNDGVGERFFGPDVPAVTEAETLEEGAAGRKWVWPRDGNKIISLVTPLMRRMVTNERQRRYAIEARRGGGKRREAAAAAAAAGVASTPQGSSLSHLASSSQMDLDDNNPSVDPALDPSSRTPLLGPAPEITTATIIPPPSASAHHTVSPPPPSHYRRFTPPQHPPPDAPSYPPTRNVIQIVVTRNNTVLLPRIDLAAATPSAGPHHGMPLAELLGVVHDEIRGLGLGGAGATGGGGWGERCNEGASEDSDEKTTSVDEKAQAGSEKANDEKTEAEAKAGTEAGPTEARPRSSSSLSASASSSSHASTSAPNPANAETEDAKPQPQPQSPRAGISEQNPPQPHTSSQPSAPAPKIELRALTPTGLRPVRTELDWSAARRDVGGAAYMEGVLRVVVEVL